MKLHFILTFIRFGTVLFYRLDTWHRGAPVKPGKVRYVSNYAWKKKDAKFIDFWNKGWAVSMMYEDERMEKIIANATL